LYIFSVLPLYNASTRVPASAFCKDFWCEKDDGDHAKNVKVRMCLISPQQMMLV